MTDPHERIGALRECLRQVEQALSEHGNVVAGTPLHQLIIATLEATQARSSERTALFGLFEPGV